MNALLYCRVSTREQAEEGYSLEAQESAGQRYASEKGWSVLRIFTDRGESARTADRPQFQEMLRVIEDDRSIRFLIVHKLDRLARNLKDYSNVRDMLDGLGVQLVSVTEGLEATASGKMVEGMLAVVAEWYSNNLSAEIRKGNSQKIKEGIWPNMAPLGYANVREEAGGKRGRAYIVPSAVAPLIRQAFVLYATGHYSLVSLVEEMYRRGLRTRKGQKVRRTGMHEILRNQAYIGKIPRKGVVHDGKHEPLVSEELFRQVQARLDSFDRARERQRRHTHPLKGLVVCGDCGKRMFYNVVRNHAGDPFGYFVCGGYTDGRRGCGAPYAPARQIEADVDRLYADIKLPAGIERALEAELEREVAEEEQRRALSTEFIGKRLAKLANDRQRLLDLYLDGDLDRDTFRERHERIAAETAELERQQASQTESLEEVRELIKLAVWLAENCAASYQAASPETRKLLNQAVFDKIVVKDRTIARATYAEPFATLLTGSVKGGLVETVKVQLMLSISASVDPLRSIHRI